MRILVTNDDGITSAGLIALKDALGSVGEVTVIAPDHNWSASGHTKTLHKPLRVAKVAMPGGDTGYACSGTPSDCVALAMLGFAGPRPDLVVSGINLGANLGGDITYSGTVAAAMEGVVSGVPSIAVSLATFTDFSFEAAAAFSARLSERVLEEGIGSAILLNVNVPNLPPDQIKGVAVTRLGTRVYNDHLIERQDPFGRTYYWIGGEVQPAESGEDTDVAALAGGSISVTPIHMDLTNYPLMERLRSWELRP